MYLEPQVHPNATTRQRAQVPALTETRPLPHRVGCFVVHRELGRGGMGRVLLARDTRTGTPVALKIPTTETGWKADEDSRTLRNECRVLTRIRSRHVPRPLACSFTSRPPYLALEYVKGWTLQQILRSGPLTPAESWAVLRPVLRALASVHAAGFVHRDVKPGNIVVGYDRVALVDFGLATPLPLSSEPPLLTLAMGTPAYVSPEQASGNGPTHVHSDLYSFGCVLYECLTGSVPHAWGSFEEVEDLSPFSTVAPPSSLRRGLPPALDSLVHDLLQSDPSRRPASAFEVEGRLRATFGRTDANCELESRRRVPSASFRAGRSTATSWRPRPGATSSAA